MIATLTPEQELAVITARDAGVGVDQFLALAGRGIGFHFRQYQASAAARDCDRDGGPVEIGYGGARGGGKSFWLMAQIGVDDCQRFPGLKALVLRKVLKSVRESFEDFLPKVFSAVPYKYARGLLEFPNGSKIILGHFARESDIDAYLGLEYDVIGIEEATTLSRSKMDAIRSVNRTSKNWRPRIYSTTNPGGIGHAWYKARFIDPWRKGEQGETRFIPATVHDNPFVNAGYVKVLEGLHGWQRQAWLEGDWDIAAGQYFVNFRFDRHVIKPFSGPVPLDWSVWLAMDYGFTHWNMVYLLAQSNDGIVYVLDEHGARGWLPNRHSAAIMEMLERNHISRHRVQKFVAGGDVFQKDSDGRTVAERYAAHGWRLEPANMDRIIRATTILDMLGDVDNGAPIKLFVTERCPRLIECIPEMVHNPNHPEDVLKVDTDEDGVGGDDPYDAVGYGILAARGRGNVKVA